MEEDGTILCDECKLPAGKIVGTALVIEHRHHGRKHKTVVEIADLISLMSRQVVKCKKVLAGDA